MCIRDRVKGICQTAPTDIIRQNLLFFGSGVPVLAFHFENGFDDKLDYYTLEEAEKAAQGYVDGTMEDDGFKYDGAAVYGRIKVELYYSAGAIGARNRLLLTSYPYRNSRRYYLWSNLCDG